MTGELRCEKCGKLLNVDAARAGTVTCPRCNKRTPVPAALASLPRPKVPATVAAPTGEEPQGQGQEGEAVMTVMAGVMPWVMSAFFHLALILLMAFFYIFVQGAPGEEVTPPKNSCTDNPMAKVRPKPQDPRSSLVKRQPKQRHQYNERTEEMRGPKGLTDNLINVIGPGPGGGDDLISRTGPDGLPGPDIFDTRAYHVIYVIDISGSMEAEGIFDIVRRRLAAAIGRLSERQDFHVIFFSDGPPLENPPRRLVQATRYYKKLTADFLKPLVAAGGGGTDPVPALTRAFDVLDRADKRQGKLIQLLTDGVFRDNEKVMATIRKRNKKKDVQINTFLYGCRDKVAESILKTIKAENGGRYKFISRDE